MMEKLEDILRRIKERENILRGNMDIWLSDERELEEDSGSKCAICHGAKFVHPLLSSGKPDFRRVIPCICASEELEKEKFKRLQKYSNLGSLTRLTFENLIPDGRQTGDRKIDNFRKVFDAAKAYALSPQGWFIIIGQSGCGKTHLACAIANYQISISRPVFYIEVLDLLDHLRSALRDDSDIKFDDLFEQVKNTPLLILDDLNFSVGSVWAKEKIQQLLNHRFNRQLPTVITSNISAEELDEKIDCHLMDPDLCHIYEIVCKTKTKLLNFSGLEFELIKKMTFKNFDYKRMNLTSEERQNLEQAYKVALNFAQSPQGWLIFLGENGCGKTHLAASIANYLYENSKPVLFIVVPDFLDHLRSAFSPDSRISYDDLFEKVKNTLILILDDFGEQAATPWAQEKLYQLINYRYNARLATVITTCYSLDEIESRISSRMVDPSLSLVFNIIAPDYRGDRKSVKKNVITSNNKKTGKK